jgi:hypothetical protein
MSDFITAYGLPFTYIVLGIAVLSAILFPLVQMFQDLKKARTAFLGIAAVIAVFFLCWAMAKNEPFAIGTIKVTGEQMQWVEAGIFTFYALLAISVAAILYSTVSRYFK